MSTTRALIDLLVDASLGAADPGPALERAWPRGEAHGACRVLSVGKAAARMMRAVLERGLCDVESGLVIGPVGMPAEIPGARVIEVDHPLATARNIDAARACNDFVRSWNGPLVVLLSGGASALMMLPAEGIALEDCREMTRGLLRAGATIEELNCVRKHVERLKGGGMARVAGASAIRVFVLSDVIGDDLSTIASGPLCGDRTTYAEAMEILERYGLAGVAPACTAHLRDGAAGRVPETMKPGDPLLARVEHRVIGNNATVVEGVARRVSELGLRLLSVETGVTGEARDVGARLARRASEESRAGHPGGAAIVIGGETTVTVKGNGVGGRNQELALAAALGIAGMRGVTIASWSTDGVDGMTDAAGAVATGESAALAARAGVLGARCLEENDSHRFFEACGGLLRTGPTGTNLNDVAVALVGGPEKLGG